VNAQKFYESNVKIQMMEDVQIKMEMYDFYKEFKEKQKEENHISTFEGIVYTYLLELKIIKFIL